MFYNATKIRQQSTMNRSQVTDYVEYVTPMVRNNLQESPNTILMVVIFRELHSKWWAAVSQLTPTTYTEEMLSEMPISFIVRHRLKKTIYFNIHIQVHHGADTTRPTVYNIRQRGANDE